jgi:hypothetical protein
VLRGQVKWGLKMLFGYHDKEMTSTLVTLAAHLGSVQFHSPLFHIFTLLNCTIFYARFSLTLADEQLEFSLSSFATQQLSFSSVALCIDLFWKTI